MTPLYRWPPAARLGRVVPKAKLHEHVRDKLTQVRRVTWAYKLADETIHLPGTDAVPEIQVFVVEARDDDVGDDVLAAIDKAVQFPIIFEVSAGERVRMVAAHQRSPYFSTGWHPADAPRVPLPPAVDLPGLYTGLLTPLLPVPPRPGESLSVAAGRMEQARKLEREIAALERRLRTEPQLNRKIELRRELLARTAALADLVTTKDARGQAEDTLTRPDRTEHRQDR